MKPVGLKSAVLAVSVVVATSIAGRAEGPPVRNCTWCHGTSGQGLTPAPRLAGQRPLYIESQLRDFGHHTRDNPYSRQYMWSVGENLPPETVHAFATYFASVPPIAANDGDARLVEFGKTIYQVGMPDANIAACTACHGPNGEGIADIPRLSGLAYTYLKRRLEAWGEGFHAGAKYPMARVAKKLSPDQIEALASYLSFLQ